MNLTEYYDKIYTLSFINRYTNVIRVKNEDVAQHSFFVAALVLKLHEKYDFDLGKALQAAISHDMSEADLSDVTHDVKVNFPDLAHEISIAELEVLKKYPKSVLDGVEIFLSNSTEGLIANLADVVQVQQYLSNEISLGNKKMFQIEAKTRERRNALEQELKQYERIV